MNPSQLGQYFDRFGLATSSLFPGSSQVENAISLVRLRLRERSEAAIRQQVEALVLKLIVVQHPHLVRPMPSPAPTTGVSIAAANASEPADDASAVATATAAAVSSAAATASSMQQALDVLKERLRNLELEGLVVEVELPVSGQGGSGGKGGSGGPFSIDLGSLGGAIGGQSGGTMAINLERLMGSKKEKKKMTVAEARTVLGDGEAERMFPADVIAKEAVRLTESDGIVFIDEIDKVRGILGTCLSDS